MDIEFGIPTAPEIGSKLNLWEEMKIDVDVGDSSCKFDSYRAHMCPG